MPHEEVTSEDSAKILQELAQHIVVMFVTHASISVPHTSKDVE